MVNRIVKQTRDWYGVKTSANDLIRRFLADGEGKMFGEISKHLASQGVKYSKKGLHLRLESLQNDSLIEKKQTNKPYPTYHLITKSTDYSHLGWWMNYYTDHVISSGNSLLLNTKQRLRLMTTLIGVFAIYAEIQSWKVASLKKSHKEQFRVRSSFLSQALPLLTTTSHDEFKERFFGLGHVPGMYKYDKFRNEMYDYEKHLKKSFPVEYKLCKDAFEAALEVSRIGPKI